MIKNYSNQEADRKAAASKYETLISTGKLGGWEFNFKTGEFWCSREYFDMLGRGTKDMPQWQQYPLKEAWVNLLHPDNLEGAQAIFADYLQKLEGLHEQTLRMQNADGTYTWILCRAQALRNSIDNSLTGLLIGTHIDITKIKMLELELESSRQASLKDNALLRSIINSPVDVYVVAIDKNYNCIAFTDAYKVYIEKIFGKKLQVGANILSMFAEHIRPTIKDAYDLALSGKSFKKDLALDHDGVNVTFNENIYSPIIGQNGEIIGITVIVRDVTEVKKIERSNRLNEMRYSALFTGASDAIVIANSKTGIIEDANVKACELLGYSITELIGLHQINLHPNSEHAFIKQKFLEFAESTFFHSVESNALHKSGKVIPVLVTAGSAFQVEDNFYLAGYFKDLSDVKAAESKIESTLELLSSAENISHTGSVEINMYTGARIWSDEFFRILGYEPGEVKPKRELFIDHIHPKEKEEFVKWQIAALEKEGKSASIEVTIISKDRLERVMLISGMTYFDQSGHPFKHIAVLNDITDRYRMIKDLEKQNQQLMEIAWSQSHLVRAPLARIMGLANAIQRGVIENKQIPEFLNYIQESAQELDQVITEITHKASS
ncbi:MAG: PAS domain S-box protein [Bacteroidota bacterium]